MSELVTRVDNQGIATPGRVEGRVEGWRGGP
jgi:hypothetical protein